MKKIKILLIILVTIIALYGISILLFRKTINITESTGYFLKTKYDSTSIVKNIDSSLSNKKEQDSTLKLFQNVFSNKNDIDINIDSVIVERRFIKLNDSINAEYFIIQPKVIKKIGIYFLGNSSTVFTYLHNLCLLSFNTGTQIFVLNYRGFGNTNGEPSFKNQLADNQKFYDTIALKNKVDFIMGHSLGTVFSTYLATDNKIGQLYLLATYSDFSDLLSYMKKMSFGGWKILLQPFFNFTTSIDISNSDKKKNYNGSLRIIHGTKDTNLPYIMAEHVYDNCPSNDKKLITIKDGEHDAAFLPQNWADIINMLK